MRVKVFSALGHRLGQIALHQAQPVAVDDHFVVGIHSGDGVFAVHDGGQRSFHENVFHARRIGLTDRAGGVDLQFEVQAVVLEQQGKRRQGIALKTDQLSVIVQAGIAATLETDDQLAVDQLISRRVGM